MIQLIGQAKLSGNWPKTGDTVLMMVDDSFVEQSQSHFKLNCFYGGSHPFFAVGEIAADPASVQSRPSITFPASLDHLSRGDIVAISRKSGRVRVLFRKQSRHNSLLVTERCDNYCLMCSQPPRDVADESLVDEILALIPHLPADLIELGFTGGEPTIRGGQFINVLQSCKENLPNTAVHVLTNGRKFSDRAFAKTWSEVQHPDLMAGIPIYSDQSHIHDFVVQADGAFDETVRGILNLKSLRQKVELRIVLHRHTIGRIVAFANFISRNLSFVDHVALMGLELMGFATAHEKDLWIRVSDHAELIADAAEILSDYGLRVSIYNVPLCLLAARTRHFAVTSISDWKREYWPACDGCAAKEDCGGVFFSSKRRLSDEIHPL